MTFCLRRREFIAGFGGAAGWPLAARVQPGERVRRISVLTGVAENDPEAQARVTALTQGLRGLGWTEGRNLRIEYRGIVGGGIDRIRADRSRVVESRCGAREHYVHCAGIAAAKAVRSRRICGHH